MVCGKGFLQNKTRCRSSRPEVFCEKDVLRNFAKFTGKDICQNLFFNKVGGLFLKRGFITGIFLRILQNF